MIYQLSNGKIVYISVEQFLDMTDEDLQDLLSYNFGIYPESPFHNSINKKAKRKSTHDGEDNSIDYDPDNDEMFSPPPTPTLDDIIDTLEDFIDEGFDLDIPED